MNWQPMYSWCSISLARERLDASSTVRAALIWTSCSFWMVSAGAYATKHSVAIVNPGQDYVACWRLYLLTPLIEGVWCDGWPAHDRCMTEQQWRQVWELPGVHQGQHQRLHTFSRYWKILHQWRILMLGTTLPYTADSHCCRLVRWYVRVQLKIVLQVCTTDTSIIAPYIGLHGMHYLTSAVHATRTDSRAVVLSAQMTRWSCVSSAYWW